ncbi:MAG: DUF927 domain-containing protein [Spartobacteria bacterium]|nr:DUF927 domain-containing protein [Spartobacteria bacterium]
MSLNAEQMFEPLTSDDLAQAETAKPTDRDAGTPIVPVPANVTLDVPAHRLGVPLRVWDYNDAERRLLFRVCRFIGSDGKKEDRPLSYRQYKDGSRRWAWKGLDAPRPLYGLDRLAAKSDAPVIVCEGEKATDAASKLFADYVAVTSPNGSKSPDKADWKPLAGRAVTIWPDHDDSGRQYARAVAKLANEAGARSVLVVNVPEEISEKWDVADALPEGWTVEILAGLLKDAEPPEPGGPKNFECRKDGVYKVKVTEDRKTGDIHSEWIKICGPLDVLAVTSNGDSEEWGRLVKVTNRDGVSHVRAISMDMFASPDGKELRSYLFNLGLELESPDKFTRDALYEYLCKAATNKRALCVPRTGWHDGVFVMPDAVIGKSERIVVLQSASGFDHNYRTRGTFEEWQERIARYGAGNSRLALALSAAFAAPLLGLVRAESGGVHFRGRSSIGKSTILHVAGSVWGGNGNKGLGYLQQWRATDNGLEGVCVAHSDALLCLDELSQVDPKAAGSAAYMIANESGKVRAQKTGEWRKPRNWRVLFLSNGEISLSDKLAEDGRGRKLAAGQQVRVIDLPADAGAGLGLYEELHGFESAAAFSDHLKIAASKYYGHAARRFLEQVAGDKEKTVSTVEGFIKDFVKKNCPKDADGQVRRMTGRFALIAAGGELATALGILPWRPGEASNAAVICLKDVLNARGGTEPAEVQAVISQIRQFIELHGESRFSPWQSIGEERTVINRAGFKKPGENGLEYYFTPEVWKSEVCKGIDAGYAARILADRSILKTRSNGKLQRMERLPGYGKPTSCYVISQTVLFEEEGEENELNSEF